nr:hypothetical protein [Aquisphaera giovannonii]
MDDELGRITELPAPGGQVDGQQLLLAADEEAVSNPPASRYAERRTTEAPARKPSRKGPGIPGPRGRGLRSRTEQMASSLSSGPTRTRAVTTASRGDASIRSAALRRHPGSHQVSSSQNAT